MTDPKTRHTPGKWEARGDHIGVWHRYKSGVKDMVHFVTLATASVPRRRKDLRSYHEGVAEMTANAQLIAKSPEMLAFIEDVVADIEDGCFDVSECEKFARKMLASVRGEA